MRSLNHTTMGRRQTESQDVMATAKHVMNKTSIYGELPEVNDRRGLTVTGGITTDGESEVSKRRRASQVPDETTYMASQLEHIPTLERNSSGEDE